MVQPTQKDLTANVAYLRGQLLSLEYALSECLQARAGGDRALEDELLLEADEQLTDLTVFWELFARSADGIIQRQDASELTGLEEQLGKMRMAGQ